MTKKYKRSPYVIIRERIKEKNPGLTHSELDRRVRIALAARGTCGNWHKAGGGIWEFPIDANLTIKLEPGSLKNSFYVEMLDKCYYNPSGDSEIHLEFITDVNLRCAKMTAIRLAAEYLYNNTLHFQKAWDKLQVISRTKSQQFKDTIKSVQI